MTASANARGAARSLTPLDSIFQIEDLYEQPDLWNGLQRTLLHNAVEHHLEQLPAYRRLFERRGGNLDRIAEIGGEAIPLVPVRAFKDTPELLRAEYFDPEQMFASSGTSGGRVSKVARDETTLSRLLGSVDLGTRDLLDWPDYLHILNLGPGIEHAQGVWFTYVMGLVELEFPSDALATEEQVDVDRAAELLASDLGAPKALVGPPPLVHDLAVALRERDLRLRDLHYVITGGGWKRRAGEDVGRDGLVDAIHTLAGGEEVDVRDTFNMVELNTVLFECSAGWMHAPPWLHLQAVDPTYAAGGPLGDRPGLLAFCDATAASYPGFVLTEDVVRVRPPADPCPCGAAGHRLRYVRRVRRTESRGCARSMDLSAVS